MDWEKINCYVLEKQHLINKCNNIVECVEDIAGINSITATAPYLSLFNRIDDFKKSMLDEEMYVNKNLCRLRLMRSTLFIVTRKFLPIAYSATIDTTQKRLAGFRKEYDLSEKEFEELKGKIIAIIGDHEKTTAQIHKELGTDINASIMIRLLMEDVPLLRGRPLGTWKGEQFRYSLIPHNIKIRMDSKEAKVLLFEKFLQSFGPVTLDDFAWWSGLGKKESKKNSHEIKTIDIGDSLLLLEREAKDFDGFKPGEESLLLMSACDQYVITYKHSMLPRFVNQKCFKNIYNVYGELHDPILRNGRIIGRWYLEEGRVKYQLYEKIKNMTGLNQKAAEMERFYRDNN